MIFCMKVAAVWAFFFSFCGGGGELMDVRYVWFLKKKGEPKEVWATAFVR